MPLAGSLSLKNSTVAQRNNLVSDCVAAPIAHERAVERGTHEKQTRPWERWKKYAKSIGIKDDFYLKKITQEEYHVLIGAFAMAVRDARFLRSSHEKLVANTVQDTAQYVCVTFHENGHPNPTLDKDRKPAFMLQQEFRSFKNTDPEEQHQQAIPISVISKIAKQDSTNLKQATAQLATVVIFFAIRSCEYMKVQASNQCRTETMRLCNIRFFTGTKQLEHNHSQLEFADCVAITFERQN